MMAGAPAAVDLAGELRTEVSRLAYHLRTPATRLGVTPTRLAALAALQRMPQGCRQGDLAAQMGISPASTTRLVEVMLEAGWVARERDPEDQRAYVLRLSPHGEQTLENLRQESTTALSEDIEALDPAEREALAAAMPVLRALADRRLRAVECGHPSDERGERLMSDAFVSGSTTVTGHGGDTIEAYAATPVEPTGAGGVVVIHHMPGFDEATKEIVRRFASWGYAAICPNLHHRDAPGAEPDDAAAANRANGGVADEQLVGDVRGAVEHLKAVPGANGRTATIGFCSGGRQSLLAACSLDVDAAIDCYGAFVLADPPPERAMTVTSLRPVLGNLRAPLLGLFGAEDLYPSPAEVAELDALLTAAGKEHTFHSFEDAGHGFFAVNRPSYRVAAATEAWPIVHDFVAEHLGAPHGWGR